MVSSENFIRLSSLSYAEEAGVNTLDSRGPRQQPWRTPVLRFRVGEEIRHPGADGTTQAAEVNKYFVWNNSVAEFKDHLV